MKVLKYGEGYEPKVAICKNCKSEIEYLKIEENDGTPYYIDFNRNIYIDPPPGDSIGVYTKVIDCPVCNFLIITRKDEQPINTLISVPEQPKKRWWQK